MAHPKQHPSSQAALEANQPAEVDLLLIGNITRDLIGERLEEGWRLGGTVSFAAITAQRLGRTPLIVTRAMSPDDLQELPENIARVVLPSATSTTFANIYTKQGRVQYCFTPAPPIDAVDIPAPLRKPRAVLLGPIANEVGADIPAIFPKESLVAAVPQGWMRRWDESGRVFSKAWESAQAILPHLDVMVLSLEDIDYDLKQLESFIALVPTVVVTEYRDGSTLFQRTEQGVKETKIPPRPANEVDPTGAGDIFATAFILRLQETGDAVQSARFANVTASFGVEHWGVQGIPTHQQVIAYMEQHPFHPG